VAVPVPATRSASRNQQTVIIPPRAVFERKTGLDGERLRPMNLPYCLTMKDYKKIRYR